MGRIMVIITFVSRCAGCSGCYGRRLRSSVHLYCSIKKLLHEVLAHDLSPTRRGRGNGQVRSLWDRSGVMRTGSAQCPLARHRKQVHFPAEWLGGPRGDAVISRSTGLRGGSKQRVHNSQRDNSLQLCLLLRYV